MIREVLRMGDHRLLRRARPVEAFGTPELLALVADMRDTMAHLSGAGLAAPQIGVDLRVVIFGGGPSARYPDAAAVPDTVLINPLLTPLSGLLAGVLIRQFFVLRHRGQIKWWLPAAGVALLAVLIVLMAPKAVDASGDKVSMASVRKVVEQRCVTCHATQPTQPGFAQAPKGVVLQTPEQIGQHAAKMAETVASGYMPLGNLTGITDDERKLIATWYAQGARLAN